MGTEFQRQDRQPAAPPGAGGRSLPPGALSQRVLALQRVAGNAAVTRVLARDSAPAPVGVAQPPIDLFPWYSKDPATRMRAEQDLLWAAQRPKAVTITVTAAGLQQAAKTVVTAPPAPTNTDAPTQAPAGSSSAGPGTTVPVATSQPLVKGVQVQVSYGLAAEAHSKPTGPGSGKDESPSTDWQSSAQVALTVVYHDANAPGWEWSQQFQVNWSDTTLLRSLSPTALQNIQIGSQVAYVWPLWKNAQAQIFGQIMFGLTPDGKPVSQVAGGGQLQMKVNDHLSLFLQAGVGATENSGTGRQPSYTGDASVQGGIIYQF